MRVPRSHYLFLLPFGDVDVPVPLALTCLCLLFPYLTLFLFLGFLQLLYCQDVRGFEDPASPNVFHVVYVSDLRSVKILKPLWYAFDFSLFHFFNLIYLFIYFSWISGGDDEEHGRGASSNERKPVSNDPHVREYARCQHS